MGHFLDEQGRQAARDRIPGEIQRLVDASPRKIGEFILSVLQMQRSIDGLKKQNETLAEEIRRLQRQVDAQAGQLKAIQSFIQTAVYDHAARSGERAALTLIQQFVAKGSDKD